MKYFCNEFCFLSCIRILYVLLLIQCFESGETLSFCHFTHDSSASCENLTAIPYQRLPKSIVVLELTSCSFGAVLRQNEVIKLRPFKFLRSLYLTSNKFDLIEDNTFLSLNLLSSLDISGNRIRVFSKNTFAGLRSLIYLYASDNLLSFIAPRTFAALPFVQFLDLEQNNLTYIANELFYLKDLSTLLLANNQITEIHSKAFAKLSNLWHLSLLGNRLSHPKSTWFRNIVQNDGILELDFRSNSMNRNPWNCCSNVSEYRDFVKSLSNFLQCYSQLNIKCHLPSNLFSRYVKTLSNKEINSSCSNSPTLRKKSFRFHGASSKILKNLSISKDVTTYHTSVSVTIISENILSSLSNAEIFFLLAFFVVFGGGCVAFVGVILKRDKRNTSETKGSTEQSTNKCKKSTRATTRLFRQDVPAYGVTDLISRAQNNFWSKRHLVVPRDALSSPEIDDSIIPKSLESMDGDFPVEVDKSEDETWTAVDRKNSEEK